MPQSSRTFRVFVSSTFSDLKLERNALQKYVFPRLRQLAMSKGCRFQAIDLRWGVSEEAALDQQTMKICLSEIERCQKVSPRPNFIILLGDRFGWRPLPFAIPQTEFDLLKDSIKGELRKILEWTSEQGEDEKGWYRLDRNAVPPEYVLQPRLPGSEFANYDTWVEKVEQPLVKALEKAALNAGLEGKALEKYTLSATAQEIMRGALDAAGSQEHVFAALRSFANLEAIQNKPAAGNFYDHDSGGVFLQESYNPLMALKVQVTAYLSGQVHAYTADWQPGGMWDDPEEKLPDSLEDCRKLGAAGQAIASLCDAAYEHLASVIEAEAGVVLSYDEQRLHADFASERAQNFTGREELLARIASYLAADDPHPLVIWGPSGSGKSALLAKAYKNTRENHPNSVIISRWIGATPDSSNSRAFLEELCHQVTHAYHGDESTIPSEYNRLVPAFAERLKLAGAGQPLLLFLDALDQLSGADAAVNLAWLPPELPPHVRLVVSTLPGACLDTLRYRLPDPAFLAMPGMTREMGEILLRTWLTQAGRTLDTDQRNDILDKFTGGGGLPLFLKLAFEESRLWHAYDGLPYLSDAKPGLSADIPGILRDLFWRLEQKNNHGQVLVAHTLGYLLAAKNGLSEDEMLDLLWQDKDVKNDFFARSPNSPAGISALPIAVWSRLYLDLEPYLAWRKADDAELLGFYHTKTFRAAVKESYARGDQKTNTHQQLAKYFKTQAIYTKESAQPKFNYRKLSELPFQQTMGNAREETTATLTDLGFITAKATALGPFAVQEDLKRALGSFDDPLLSLFDRQFDNNIHFLQKGETLKDAITILCSRLKHLEVFLPACQRLMAEQEPPRLSPQQILPDLSHPSLVRTLSGLTGAVRFVAYSPKPVNLACVSGSRYALISAHEDGTLKLWDAPTGQELQTLSGHTEVVHCVAFSPDGSTVASASEDQTLKVWDTATGRELHTLSGHTARVMGVTYSRDGRTLISASHDKTLKVWDVQTGQVLHTLSGHAAEVSAVACSPDGSTAVSASFDLTLKVWNILTGQEVLTLKGHLWQIFCAAYSQDGSMIASGSWDKFVKLWDARTGQEIRTLKGHTGYVTGIAFSPDGSLLVSASVDLTLRVWDVRSGQEVYRLFGHTGHISSVAYHPAGRSVASSSLDQTIKIWDVMDGIRTISGHTGMVSGVAFSPDGCQVASASDDFTVKLWAVSSGQELRTLKGHTRRVNGVAFSQDGKTIASASYDQTLKLWDADTGQEVRTLKGHVGPVNGVCFSPDGRTLASTSLDKTLKLWDVQTGQQLHTLTGHTGFVFRAAFSPDSRTVVSASADHTLKIWDVATGHEIRTLKGHQDAVIAVACADQFVIISSSMDHLLKMWDAASGREIRTLTRPIKKVTDWIASPDGFGLSPIVSQVNDPMYVTDLVCSRDGGLFMGACSDGTLKVWNMQTGQELRTMVGHMGMVTGVAYSPDGRTVVSSSVDKTLKLWDAATIREFRPLTRHAGSVTSVAYSPDGRTVTSASDDHTLIIWDALTGQERYILQGGQPVLDVSYSPDGCCIVSSSTDQTLKVWDVHTGQNLRTLSGHSGPVSSAAWSPDGCCIVSSSTDQTLKVWDVHTGQNLRTLSGHSGPVSSAAWSPDGCCIVSSSTDQTLKVWDVHTGQNLRTLSGHSNAVWDVTYSADGSAIVSASADKSLKVTDARTGQDICTLTGHAARVNGVACRQDGRFLASVSNDKTLKIWDCNTWKCLLTYPTEGILCACAWSPEGMGLVLGGIGGLYWLDVSDRVLAPQPGT